MALDVEEAPAIAMVLEGASKKKPSPLSSAPIGDEERAKALKGAIKLCLSEEGY